jgi:hypothetical protein
MWRRISIAVILTTSTLTPFSIAAPASKSPKPASSRSLASLDDTAWLQDCQKKCSADDAPCQSCCKKRAFDLKAICPGWCGGTKASGIDELAKKLCAAKYGGNQPLMLVCIGEFLTFLPSLVNSCDEKCWSVNWKNFDPKKGCSSGSLFEKSRK